MTFQTNKSWEQNIQDHSSICSQLGAPGTTSPTHSKRSSWNLDEVVASHEMLLLWPVRPNLSSDDISMSDISGLQRHKNGKNVLVETTWKLKEKLFRHQDLGRTSIQLPFHCHRFSICNGLELYAFWPLLSSFVDIFSPRYWGLGIGGVGQDWSCTWPVVTGFFCMAHCVFVRRIYFQIAADCTLILRCLTLILVWSWAFDFQKSILIDIDAAFYPSESERATYSSSVFFRWGSRYAPVVERTSALQNIRGFCWCKKHQQLRCWRNQHVQLAAGFLTAWRLWWRRGWRIRMVPLRARSKARPWEREAEMNWLQLHKTLKKTSRVRRHLKRVMEARWGRELGSKRRWNYNNFR